MKKSVCTLLAVLMLASALLIAPVSAETTDLNDYLLVDWDFEGATQEEGLKDKADGGTKEDLILTASPVDANAPVSSSLASDTRVENGKLFISAADNNRAQHLVADNSDLKKATEMTFYLEYEMITPNNHGVDALFVKGRKGDGVTSGVLVRQYVSYVSAEAAGKISTRMCGFSADHRAAEPYKRGTKVCYAISVKMFPTGHANAGQFCFNVYSSYDNGETWVQEQTDLAKKTTNVASIGTIWSIELGKGSASTGASRVGTFIYDNVRIYNKALTQAEVESVCNELKAEPAPALYHGVQFKTYTEGEKNLFDTRLIAQVSENAAEAGFIVYATDSWVQTSTANLYQLSANVTRCYSSVLEKGAQVTSDAGKKFIVLNVEGADQAKLPIFTVIPWEKDANGNVTYGKTQLIHVTAEMLAE